MFRNRRLDNGCVIMLICCGRIKNSNDASPSEIRKLVYYNFWNMELDEMIDEYESFFQGFSEEDHLLSFNQ